jgi:hypothetical protein
MIRVTYPLPTTSEHLKTQDSTKGQKNETIGLFKAEYELTMRQKNILKSLVEFYNIENTREILVPILSQKTVTSLRAIDWLVTNYSKKKNIVLQRKDKLFNIHNEYKNALSYYRRRNFDPFRRRLRLGFSLGDNSYQTTVGQLNFIYWAYTNNIFEYAFANIKEIEKDMQITAQKLRQEKKNTSYRRKELSRPPTRKVSIYEYETLVKFGS